MEEVWKDIKDYEGIYQVSNLGRIKRLPHRVKNRFGTCCRKEHYIGYKGTNGYMYVLLHKDNTPSTFLIHRLVAQAFIDNPNNYDCINHKDENPLNNCVNNLEWCDIAYNNNYGTIKQRRSIIMDAHPKTSKVVICELSNGNKIEYPSARKAAKSLGVSSSTIINRCNGKYGEYNGMKFYYK